MTAKVPLMATVSASTGVDSYFPLMNCRSDINLTDEASAQTPFFVDGVLSNLYVSVFTNASSGTSFARIRINGSNGNSVISIGAGINGRFFDNSSTDSISNGDVACTLMDRGGGGNLQVGVIGAQYKTNSGVLINKVGVSGSTNYASGTSYTCFTGAIDTVSDNSAAATPRITVPGTIKNFHAYSNANTRSNVTTFRIRINGSDGNGVLSFAAGVAGLATNSSSSDAIIANDNLNTSRVTSTGSGAFTLRQMGFEIHYPAREINLFSNDSGGLSLNATAARYFIPSGSFTSGGSSILSTIKLYGSGVLSDFYLNVLTNAATAAQLFDVRTNNSNTSIGVSVPITTTGTFSDTSNTHNFSNEDYLDYRYLKATGSGATVIRWFSLKVIFDSTFKPMVTFF